MNWLLQMAFVPIGLAFTALKKYNTQQRNDRIIAEVHRCTEELTLVSNGWGPSSVGGNGLEVRRLIARLPRPPSPANGPIEETALHLPQKEEETQTEVDINSQKSSITHHN
jgi:hypothetical protein